MSEAPWKDILCEVPPDQPLFLAGACGEPTAVLRAACEAPDLFAGRDIFTSFVPGVNTSDATAGAAGAQLHSLFPSPKTAPSSCSLLPWPYSRYFHWLSQPGRIGLVFCQVAAAGKSNVSLGLAADFVPALLASGAPIVGQINPALPAPAGAPLIPRERFATLFEAETELPEYHGGKSSDAFKDIGRNIAALIREGDTVQLGLGKVQASVLGALKAEPRPISLHGGMLAPEAFDLLEMGILGSATVGVVLGATGDYGRVEALPNLKLTSVDKSHGSASLADRKAFVSINSALSVDLAGQATGETANGRIISGSGGLTDFHRAALAAEGGRAILALMATTRNGESTIVARHPAGTRISVGAADADYVVTEYGVADLRLRDAKGRAAALARIAAPQYRDDLERATQSERQG